jgi:hypothetical protein
MTSLAFVMQSTLEPTAIYRDERAHTCLRRTSSGKLAEHWDVVFTQPEKLPSGNDLF